MKLGVGSWAYPWSVGIPGQPAPSQPMGAFELLSVAADLGVTVVQFADNMPLDELSQADLQELRVRADASGLALELGVRGHGEKKLLDYLEIAKILGANLVRTLVVPGDERLSAVAIATQLKHCLPEYERHGIRLAVENYELYSAAEYKAIICEVNSDFLGICLDPVNNFGRMESADDVVRELAEYVVNLHYKDFVIGRIDSKQGYLLSGTPAGKGLLDANWLFGTVNAHGRCNTVILEQWVPFFGDIQTTTKKEREWAEQGIAFLTAAMEKLGILEA